MLKFGLKVLENTISPMRSDVPPGSNTGPHGFWKRLKGVPPLFICLVILPTALAFVYYLLIASDVYVSEARFVVKSPGRSSGSSSTLAQMMGGSAYSAAAAESYPVIDYIQSRDAAAELDSHRYLRNIYSNQGDWVSRYHSGWRDNAESVWRYYKRHIVDIDMDDETSIITMKTMAYQAQQAQDINRKLLAMGEQLVNKMNARAMHDAVNLAEVEVQKAEARTKQAASTLAAYRAGHGVYNPDQQSIVQLQQAAQLQARIFSAEAQLVQLKRVAPDNSQITVLNAEIEALNKQLTKSDASVIGGQGSLSQKNPEYTQAALDLQFSADALGMALTTLEATRANAMRKQLYLEEIVQPNLPVEAINPRRIRNVFITLLLGLLTWSIVKMFVESVREHKD